MGHSFKTKSTKYEATFLRKQHLFLISSCESLDQPKDTGVVRQLTNTAIFIVSYTYVKTYLAVHFTKGCFFVNLLTEKLWVQCQSITCLLEIQTRFLFFTLHKIKMSKQHRLFIYISYIGLYIFIYILLHIYSACVGVGNTLWQLSKQINKLFLQMSAQVYSVLAKLRGKRKAYFEWKSIHLSYELSLTMWG